MTKIFELGSGIWIEVFNIVGQNVAADTQLVTTFVLQKAGQFMGGSCALDFVTADVSKHELVSITIEGANPTATLVQGAIVRSISVRMSNADSVQNFIGGHAIVFMRRTGH